MKKFQKFEFFPKVVLSPTKKSGINRGIRIRLQNWKIPSSSYSKFETSPKKFRKFEFYSKVVLSPTKKSSINWGIRIRLQNWKIPSSSYLNFENSMKKDRKFQKKFKVALFWSRLSDFWAIDFLKIGKNVCFDRVTCHDLRCGQVAQSARLYYYYYFINFIIILIFLSFL